MTPEGFEPAIPASERPQTHDLDRAAIGISMLLDYFRINYNTSSLIHLVVFEKGQRKMYSSHTPIRDTRDKLSYKTINHQ
jgi:hypothetical protein